VIACESSPRGLVPALPDSSNQEILLLLRLDSKMEAGKKRKVSSQKNKVLPANGVQIESNTAECMFTSFYSIPAVDRDETREREESEPRSPDQRGSRFTQRRLIANHSVSHPITSASKTYLIIPVHLLAS
jgi:hypothetical protein